MDNTWTPAKRAKCALELGQPDEIPTFELEFQLSSEIFGCEIKEPMLKAENFTKLSSIERERIIDSVAARYARVVGEATAYDIGGNTRSGDPEKDSKPGLGYSIINVGYQRELFDPSSELTIAFRKRLREYLGDTVLFGCHGDGTFSIPSGDKMYEFAYRTADDPEGLLAEAEAKCRFAIERNKKQKDADIDVLLLCDDYCYNSGPFLSPAMFDEYITPFLASICKAGRESGAYVIKHTDGNIIPIIDSLVEAGPHALHSIDPMAGVDIREVKRLYGKRVALCGHVHCAHLQTGTDDEVRQSTEYCLRYGGEGGGYIFATSNVPFKGMPPHRYEMILDIWKSMRKY